ncbi:MAG: CDP-alcohol phosphatidyltransferase family protein [Candidatus Geothermarchaeales archaeon]
MVLNKIRERFQGTFKRMATFFAWLGLEPYMVSLLSIVLALLASLLFYFSLGGVIYIGSGILLFCLSSLLDAIDGAMARMQGKVSEVGAFMDSFSDRVVEVLVIGAIILAGMLPLLTGLLFLSTSFLISYARARAESLGVDLAGVGLMERAERTLFLLAGIILWTIDKRTLNMVLLIASALNTYTLIQRLHKVLVVSKSP